MGRVGCRWLLVKSARDEDQPTSDRAGALIDGADHAVNEQAHGEAAEHGKPARDRIARVSRRGNIADPRNAGDRDKRDRHDAKDRQSGVPGRRRGTLRHEGHATTPARARWGQGPSPAPVGPRPSVANKAERSWCARRPRHGNDGRVPVQRRCRACAGRQSVGARPRSTAPPDRSTVPKGRVCVERGLADEPHDWLIGGRHCPNRQPRLFLPRIDLRWGLPGPIEDRSAVEEHPVDAMVVQQIIQGALGVTAGVEGRVSYFDSPIEAPGHRVDERCEDRKVAGPEGRRQLDHERAEPRAERLHATEEPTEEITRIAQPAIVGDLAWQLERKAEVRRC